MNFAWEETMRLKHPAILLSQVLSSSKYSAWCATAMPSKHATQTDRECMRVVRDAFCAHFKLLRCTVGEVYRAT